MTVADRPESGATTGAVPTLVCIDLQPVFLAATPQGQEVHWRCSFAIEAARGLGLPLLFTAQVPEKLGGVAPDLLALAATPVVLPKNTFSIFGDAAITAHLAAGAGRHLLLCGIETPICVFQSARDARRAGYAVTVLTDCIGARREGDATFALAELARAGCNILPAETVFYALLGDARQPFFKSFTALVKKYG
jgi:nicotinamidase-related amidase